MIDVYDMALAGLLHDIGKVMQRAGVKINKSDYEMRCPQYQGVPSHQHVMWTESFFSPQAKEDHYWQEIANLAASHHNASAYANTADEKYWLIKCLINADRISAMWDRKPDDEDNEKGDYKKKPLYSIFADVFLGSSISGNNALPIAPRKDDESSFPVKADTGRDRSGEYKAVFDQFQGEYRNLLKAIDQGLLTKPNLVDAVDSLLEKYFWSVPSNTKEQMPTNSLYYHSRITAGIASALFSYYSSRAEQRLELENLIDGDRQILMLVGGDLSGIQKYLFDLHPEHSKKAAKTLRARSFKIKILCDIVLQRMCRELGLPRQCILMNAGGKFMLLAPNLPQVGEYLEQLRVETDREFYTEFMGAVSLNLDWDCLIKFSDLKMEGFPDTLDRFIRNLDQAKLMKFSGHLHSGDQWHSGRFVIEQGNYYSNLCPQCGKRTVETDPEGYLPNCQHCDQEIKLGEILPKANYFVIATGQPSQDVYVQMFEGKWHLEEFKPNTPLEEDSFAFCVKEDSSRVDLHYPYKPVASALPNYNKLAFAQKKIIDDLGEADEERRTILTFDDLALLALERQENENYRGVPLNAILKGDVDNLGNIFSIGLLFEPNGREKTGGFSLTQYATLSSNLDWFFSAYLPALAERKAEYRNRVYVVYAGGDDFCLIGPWDVMLDFVIELDKHFRAFCGNHPDLHFSAALRLIHGKSPIRFGIEKAEEDLKKAKAWKSSAGLELPSKDALHLFDTTLPWQIVDKTLDWAIRFDEWLHEFDKQDGKQKGFTTQFLYRMMQYSDMATRYKEKQDIRDLLYKSYLTYDLKRNFKEGMESVEKLQELAWQDEQIRLMKVPIHKALYKNRIYNKKRGGNNE